MADTHASKDQIPAEKMGDYEGRMQQFGDYYVNFETMPAGTGGPEIFKGLPDDACQSEHWGYVFKGKVSFRPRGPFSVLRAFIQRSACKRCVLGSLYAGSWIQPSQNRKASTRSALG